MCCFSGDIEMCFFLISYLVSFGSVLNIPQNHRKGISRLDCKCCLSRRVSFRLHTFLVCKLQEVQFAIYFASPLEPVWKENFQLYGPSKIFTKFYLKSWSACCFCTCGRCQANPRSKCSIWICAARPPLFRAVRSESHIELVHRPSFFVWGYLQHRLHAQAFTINASARSSKHATSWLCKSLHIKIACYRASTRHTEAKPTVDSKVLKGKSWESYYSLCIQSSLLAFAYKPIYRHLNV